MGGCASKPKDFDSHSAPLPAEAPATPKKAEGETVPQENKEGGETKKEEPLIDISEPAQEAQKSEELPAELKEVNVKVVSEEAKPAELCDQVTADPTKDHKIEAANEPTKEEEKKVVPGVAAPKPEDKSDAPLVTV